MDKKEATIMLTVELTFVEKNLTEEEAAAFVNSPKDDYAAILKRLLKADNALVTDKKVFVRDE